MFGASRLRVTLIEARYQLVGRRRYEGCSSRCVALQLGEEFVWSLVNPLPGGRTVKAAYPGLIVLAQPANNGNKTFPDLLASLDFRSLSISTIMEMGTTSALKKAIFCSMLSSRMRNRPGAGPGRASQHTFTVTGPMTDSPDPDPRSARRSVAEDGASCAVEALLGFLSLLRLRLSEKRGQE